MTENIETPQTEKAVVQYNPNMPVKDAGTLRQLMERPSYREALAAVLPKYLPLDRAFMIVQMAVSRQPLLLQCTQGSLLQAVMTASEMGISLSGQMARGFLVPYWSNKVRGYEAKFIIGYGGLIDIICQPGGRVTHMTTAVVYKQDHFRLLLGSDNRIEHEPDTLNEKNYEDIIGAYAMAWIAGGGQVPHYMPRAEIEKHKERSSSRNKQKEIVGPWVTDYAAMCRKTPVRSIANYLPLSKEQQAQISAFDEPGDDDLGRPGPIVELQQTDGRQSWGFGKQDAAAQEVFPESEQTQAEAPTDDAAPGVSDDDRKMLVSDIAAKLARKGLKAKTDIDSAVQDMCKGLGTDNVAGIVSVDQYNAALQWIEEGL